MASVFYKFEICALGARHLIASTSTVLVRFNLIFVDPCIQIS